jgi:hypothetical protein
VAGEVGLGNPTAAPAEDLFEVHVANSFFAATAYRAAAGCVNEPDLC